VQQLGILVYSSPRGTLEPSRGDIDVSVGLHDARSFRVYLNTS